MKLYGQFFHFPYMNEIVVNLGVYLENGRRFYFTSPNVQQIALNPAAKALMLSSHYVKMTHLRKHFYVRKCLLSNTTVYYIRNVSRKSFERCKEGELVDEQHIQTSYDMQIVHRAS
ncbi:unnamed protein product [Onchocerca flexuosa]|uniref:HTH LytTR-type domain-containing protein n=1 Tax=Onchocerca flexuosa TaxID=387005 RepID=A0A183H3J8_9BILA|nr:unnamed protein product [Onchocerca flexuosa]